MKPPCSPGVRLLDVPEKSCEEGVFILTADSYLFLPGVYFPPYPSVLSVYAHPVRPMRSKQSKNTWSHQGTLSGCQAHPQVSSVGWFRLRSCALKTIYPKRTRDMENNASHILDIHTPQSRRMFPTESDYQLSTVDDSLAPDRLRMSGRGKGYFYSAGIHPWKLTELNTESRLESSGATCRKSSLWRWVRPDSISWLLLRWSFK